MRRLALLIVAMLLIAAAPARVPVRDNTVAGAITSFPASGRAYDIWNNAYNQALQQYSDDRAAYQEQEAVSTITGTKYYRGLNLRPALDSDLQPFNFLSASGVFQFGLVGNVSSNSYEWADNTGPYLTFDTANRRAIFSVPPGVPSYTVATLPPCLDGQLARVADGIRGLWICRGTTWQSVTGYADVRDFGAKGDDATDDSTAFQAAITAAGPGRRVYCPDGIYRVNNLSGIDYVRIEGPASRNDSATRGCVMKTSSHVFNIAGATSSVFRHVTFTGTASHVGVAFGSSSTIAGLGLIDVLIEECTFYLMDYAIDMPMILSRVIGNQFKGTAVRVPGGAGAANNHNTFRDNVWQLDTGKAFTLELGIAAGGSQPQGGQADQNLIDNDDFENNSGGVILLNGALVTTINHTWFEGNNTSNGTSVIKAVVSGGVNNNLIVKASRFSNLGSTVTHIIDHSAGPTHEFSDNIHSAPSGSLVDFSTGLIFRVFGNTNWPSAIQAKWGNSDLVLGGYGARYRATSASSLVAGDVALSAGWGSTASVSAISGTDQRFRFTVTSAGTGQGANPTATFTFKDGTWSTAPYAICSRNGGNQAAVLPTWTTTATTIVITFPFTPTATETYSVECIVMG